MPRGVIDYAALASAEAQAMRARAPDGPLPFDIRKVGHVVLYVTDLERAVDFYTKVLGFRVSDVYPDTMMDGGMVFMRCNADHHGVALVGAGERPGARAGMHHMAFEVATIDEVLKARAHGWRPIASRSCSRAGAAPARRSPSSSATRTATGWKSTGASTGSCPKARTAPPRSGRRKNGARSSLSKTPSTTPRRARIRRSGIPGCGGTRGERPIMPRLPVYVINLDRRPDRLGTISGDLHRLGLPFERVPAVDARLLPPEDKADRNPLMRAGSKACMLSHSEALRRFLASGRSAAMILEDDAELASDLPAVCDSTGWWPEGTGLIKLERPNSNKSLQGPRCGQTPSGRALRRVVRWNAGSAGYLIDREAAGIFLAAFRDAAMSTDRMLFDPRISKAARRVRPVQVNPPMIQQRPSESDIEPTKQSISRRQKRWHLLRRRSIPYQMLLLWWWLTGCARSEWVRYSESPPPG